jgi:hypothetical protein
VLRGCLLGASAALLAACAADDQGYATRSASVIYGEHDRLEPFAVDAEVLGTLKRSVVALVPAPRNGAAQDAQKRRSGNSRGRVSSGGKCVCIACSPAETSAVSLATCRRRKPSRIPERLLRARVKGVFDGRHWRTLRLRTST